MAITYGFFDAVYDSSTGTYDRTYTAEQMSMYFKGLVSDGVVANVGGQLQVATSSGMKVQVKTGRMFIDSRWMQNDSALTLTIPAAHATLGRKDAIIVRLDYTNRKISIIVKAGTAAASPTAPTVTRSSSLYEMKLAEITVDAGATAITAANITDTRQDQNVCGYVTGLVDQIDTATIWAQLEASFDEWFADVKGKLDGDTAGNLQNEIYALDSRIDTNEDNIAANAGKINDISDAIDNIIGEGPVISDGNFNDLTTPGAYKVVYSNNIVNEPSVAIRGVLEVVKAGDYIIQRYTEFGGYDQGKTYIRTRDAGSGWSIWRKYSFSE